MKKRYHSLQRLKVQCSATVKSDQTLKLGLMIHNWTHQAWVWIRQLKISLPIQKEKKITGSIGSRLRIHTRLIWWIQAQESTIMKRRRMTSSRDSLLKKQCMCLSVQVRNVAVWKSLSQNSSSPSLVQERTLISTTRYSPLWVSHCLNSLVIALSPRHTALNSGLLGQTRRDLIKGSLRERMDLAQDTMNTQLTKLLMTVRKR